MSLLQSVFSLISMNAPHNKSWHYRRNYNNGYTLNNSFLLRKTKNCSNIFCCQNVNESGRGFPSISTQVPHQSTQEILKHTVAASATTTSTIAVEPLVEASRGIGVVKFLEGKSYFITGATGFLAKVFIEKLLRTVPNVGKIFLLIKAENKEVAMDRLKTEVIDSELFGCIRKMHGKSYEAFMLSKLIPVVGNVCESNLGMDANSTYEIAEEIDIIINSAANTTFDERYDIALNTNTKGPCRLLNFAKKCKKLDLFLHVSTAYANGARKGIIREKPFNIGESIARERIISSERLPTAAYPMLDVDAEFKLVLDLRLAFQDINAGDQAMKELGLERAISYGWRNTYEFCKAMGEMLINSMRGDIPVVIIRPSVIQSTYKDPFPGWIEGNRMLDPLILSYGKGRLPGFFVNPKDIIDVIPVDMVVNAMIVAMAKHGIAGKSESMNDHVYHVASSVVNPLTLHDLFKFSYDHFNSYPFMDSKGKRTKIARMEFFSDMDEFSSFIGKEIVNQSELMDVANISDNKLSQRLKRKCKVVEAHAIQLAKIYEPYMFYGGWFDNGNTSKLMEDMSEEEKRNFGFDVERIKWKDYLSNIHIPGLRKHVMKGRGMPK